MLPMSAIRYRVANTAKRCLRAWRYATNHLSEDDAGWIIADVQPLSGYAVLETIDAASVLEWAEELYGPHPKLAEWVRDAIQRVGQKWQSSGDAQNAASDWAIDLVRDYAAQEGVELTAQN